MDIITAILTHMHTKFQSLTDCYMGWKIEDQGTEVACLDHYTERQKKETVGANVQICEGILSLGQFKRGCLEYQWDLNLSAFPISVG